MLGGEGGRKNLEIPEARKGTLPTVQGISGLILRESSDSRLTQQQQLHTICGGGVHGSPVGCRLVLVASSTSTRHVCRVALPV